MIYIDELNHMATDGELAELNEFAQSIGMSREWIDDDKPEHPHYDVFSKRLRARAIRSGAHEISSQAMLLLFNFIALRSKLNK
jgi:hypothetical protein